MANLSQALERSLFAESLARRPGLLQGLDPRVKLVGLLVLLLATGLARNPATLILLYLGSLVLAFASRIPLAFFVKRIWLSVLLFSGVVALPALFLTQGSAWVKLPLGLAISRAGAQTAALLVLRVGTSMSLAILLVLTTAWNSLLKAMAVLHLPEVVVLVLGMAYRYIELLLRLTNDLVLARRSRIVGQLSGAQERRLLGATAGALLTRSLDLSGEVYLAMQARGFRGYPRTLDQFRMRGRDWAAVLTVVCLAAAATWLGR